MSCDVKSFIGNTLNSLKETLDPTIGLLDGAYETLQECGQDENQVERQLPNHLREISPPKVSRLWANPFDKVCEGPMEEPQDTMEPTCNEETPATQMTCNEENLKEGSIVEVGALSESLVEYLGVLERDMAFRLFRLGAEIARTLNF